MAIDISKVETWWKDSTEGEKQWRDKAINNLKFYTGNQWDVDDLEILRKEKRPAITINKILPIINFLSGYQRQNRYIISVAPKRGVTAEECNILSEIMAHMQSESEVHPSISTQFLDGCITGRGWLYGNIDFDDDPLWGDLKIERVSPFKIKKDPNSERYDLSDCNYLIHSVWIPYEKLIQEFPEKKDDIHNSYIEEDDVKVDSSKKYSKLGSAIGFSELDRERVLVKEVWYVTIEPVWYIVGMESGDIVEETAEGELNKYKVLVQEPIKIIKRSKRVLNFTTTVGKTVLQDVKRPLGDMNKYPFVQFCPLQVDKLTEIPDNELGVVDNLIDLQKEVNKSRSQQLHIINTLAHSGWLNQDGSGADEKQLQDYGSTPGIVIKYKTVKPEQIQPQIPSNAHILAEKQAGGDMKEVSGVNPDLLGERGQRGEPGVVLNLRREGGLIVTEPLFDNLKLTHRLCGNLMIDVVLKSNLFSKQEAMELIDMKPQNQQMKLMALENLYKDKSFKRFNTVVNLEPNTPTQRVINFLKLVEVTKAFSSMGLMIPPDILLDASDLPHKEEIKQRVMAMMGQLQGGQQPKSGDVNSLVQALSNAPEGATPLAV